MKPPGPKVLVWGLGKTGFESARFLKTKGLEVYAWDQGNAPEVHERAGLLRRDEIEAEVGVAQTGFLEKCDWILISPGVPPSSEIYQRALRKKIPVYSEIEVASWFSPSSKIIGVTGSAGKTTVTTLLAQVFKKAAGRAVGCGNIGNTWIGEIAHIRPDDFIVIELSSFQLIHCQSFRPKVGVILNISPNHLDWHRDMEEYAAAKLKLFQNQGPDDYAVIRKEDEARFYRGFEFRGRKIYLDGEHPALGEGSGAMNPNEKVVRLVAGIFGISQDEVTAVLRDFRGIEHRLETVASAGGVTYVNDSKCTTTASLAWALEKFPDRSIFLIAGGKPKSKDFGTLRSLMTKKVKEAILIGDARPLLRESWEGACPLWEAVDFRQAIARAHQRAVAGDVVLLSPACASFDMFKNYGERGMIFKKTVQEITRQKNCGENEKPAAVLKQT